MKPLKRKFCLGSEWIYFKIYTGVKTADIILVEHLSSIIRYLQEENLIQKWFFIRYKDTDEHLRIRFLVNSDKNISKVISTFYPVLNDLLQKNLISKIQTDTYNREIERYGETTMEDSETLFWYDSEMALTYLNLKSQFKLDKLVLITSFLAIDSFLNVFSISIDEKLVLMNHLQQSFKNEFNANKILKKEFDTHFRNLCSEMEYFLNGNYENEFQELFETIKTKEEHSKKIVSSIKTKLMVPMLDFLQSHIHMMINRQYTSSQRMYECLIYDHLNRFYKMRSFNKL